MGLRWMVMKEEGLGYGLGKGSKRGEWRSHLVLFLDDD